jgi:hypothetical protein
MNRENEFVFGGVLTIIGIGAFLVWKFSVIFKVLAGMAVVIIAGYACWRIEKCWRFEKFSDIWPILVLPSFWLCWWPALDYWASKQFPAFLAPGMNIWWNTFLFKAGVFLGLAILSYLVKKQFFKDYSF